MRKPVFAANIGVLADEIGCARGDRSNYTLGVYGIDVLASGPRWVLFGIYDSVTENVMWEKEYAPGIG